MSETLEAKKDCTEERAALEEFLHNELCAEDAAELATACAASAPGTRRYFDRDVMLGLYPAPQKPEEENQDG